MTLAHITSREAIVTAINEYDQLGREAFLAKYGYRHARAYYLYHDGKRYDSKAIIGVAYGYQFPDQGPLDAQAFSGGEETVRRQLTKLGFDVRRDDSEPEDEQRIWDEDASRSALTPGARDVGQTKRRYWVEKTLVAGRADREQGPHALGQALWSPQRDKGGSDIYRTMRTIQPGDVVLHFVDNRRIAGISLAAATVDETFTGLPGTEWANTPAYRVPLRDYNPLKPPIERQEFLGALQYQQRLQNILTTNKGLFYNTKFNLNQGAYLTAAPRDLVKLLDDIYREKTGTGLPHVNPLQEPSVPDELLAPPVEPPAYEEPSLDNIIAEVNTRLMIEPRLVRRYHLALKTRGLVILAGVSGTGKTWLTDAYAQAVGADYLLVPVAPNWTTNEDLLGYFNPLDNEYHDTPFSRFLRRAADDYVAAEREDRTPKPYHLVLDEMNLARVEYYFASFLSQMEVRARDGYAHLHLGKNEVLLPPNLFCIGTVNVDETTHGFADKLYDRAQLIELPLTRDALARHVGDAPYRDVLLNVWMVVHQVAPFGFRVLDEVARYVQHASTVGVSWEEALDEQILHKVLPKLKGTRLGIGSALTGLATITEEHFPLSHEKVVTMQNMYKEHGFASFF